MSEFEQQRSYVRSFGPYIGDEIEFYQSDEVTNQTGQGPKEYVATFLERNMYYGIMNTSVSEYAQNLYAFPAPPDEMSLRDYHLLVRNLAIGLSYEDERYAELEAFVLGIRNGTLEEDRKAGKAYTDFNPSQGDYNFFERARTAIEGAGGYCSDGGMI